MGVSVMKKKKINFPLKLRIVKFISDINIKNKMNLMMMFNVIPVILACTAALLIFSSLNSRCLKDSEEKIITSSEQYIDASIENVISIAKTVYTNHVLYNFLDTYYNNQIEYYDAFYSLNENNSLIIAENNNISRFTVYTENETIMNGGNICRLSDNIKSDVWYHEFTASGKSMIVYCDAENQNLSIIRKLDYYNISTGECLLKIDFNSNSVNKCLKNINFTGKIFVMSGGTLLYSNLDNVNADDIDITTEYSCFTKNYYSAELEYYAEAEKVKIFNVFEDNIILEIIFIAVFLLCILCSYMIAKNMTERIAVLNKCTSEKHSFVNVTGQSAGTDEIGQLYDNFTEIMKSLAKVRNDYRQSIAMLDKCCEGNSRLLIKALESDAALTFIKMYGQKTLENTILPDTEKDYKISLRKEFELIGNINCCKNIKLNIPDKNNIPEHISVRPILIWNIVRSISEYASEQNPDTMISIDINTEYDENSFTVSIKHNGNVSSKHILKLKAIFEDIPVSSDSVFRSQYPYNPYIHIKKYYGRLLNASVSSDNGFSLILKIKNS
jgi:hypothetical protein